MRAKKQSRSVVFKSNPDGTKDITIAFRNVTLRPDHASRFWWMIDFEGHPRQWVSCEGVAVKPNMIVKLYCRMPEFKVKQVERRRVWKSIRSNSPLLLT